MRRIHELVRTDRGEAIAVVDHDGRTYSYAALDAMVRELEGQLISHGVRPGDRVVLLAENCASYIAALLALSRCDAWTIPVNARLTRAEIERIVDHAGARTVLITAGVSDVARAHATGLDALSIGPLTSGDIFASPLRDVTPEEVREDPSQTALLMYTSGTTGAPKGVMLSHANLLFSIPLGMRLRGLVPEDVVLGLLPCTHIFGLTSVVMAPLTCGSRLILMPRFDADATLAHLRDGVTVLPAVPQIYTALIARLKETGAAIDHHLRFAYAGGAPVDLTLQQAVKETFGAHLHNGYGLTEAAPSVSATRAEERRSDGSTGMPLTGVEVIIDQPNDEGIGEILIRGPNITKGYFRDPKATKAALTEDGFLRTGDLGRLQDDGALHLVGRLKELIIHSGFNVYPPEVETVLAAHPAVALAAVIGRPRAGNEDVIAFVTTTAPITGEDLRLWVRERLAAYKVPARVFIVDALPQAATGKILKNRLAQDFADLLGTEDVTADA